MSEQNDVVVSVRDLKLGVKNDEKTEKTEKTDERFRFTIEYGRFDIRLGDFVLIKGRNGSGKSTFLRLFHLQGIDYFEVTGGDIYFYAPDFPDKKSIHNYSVNELTHLNCCISFIGQEERFLSSDSAYSYIYSTCKIALEHDKSLTNEQKHARLLEVDSVIREYYDKYLSSSFLCKDYKTFKRKNVRAWSGGQQKMINVLAGIIKAKICKLRLVVMDEPLNNLDGRNKDILNKLIRELMSEGSVAVMAITHCQIFDGVNKVLQLEEGEDGVHRATLWDIQNRPEDKPHKECLEDFQV